MNSPYTSADAINCAVGVDYAAYLIDGKHSGGEYGLVPCKSLNVNIHIKSCIGFKLENTRHGDAPKKWNIDLSFAPSLSLYNKHYIVGLQGFSVKYEGGGTSGYLFINVINNIITEYGFAISPSYQTLTAEDSMKIELLYTN